MFPTNSLFIPCFPPSTTEKNTHHRPPVLSNFSTALGRSASGKAATLRESTNDVSDRYFFLVFMKRIWSMCTSFPHQIGTHRYVRTFFTHTHLLNFTNIHCGDVFISRLVHFRDFRGHVIFSPSALQSAGTIAYISSRCLDRLALARPKKRLQTWSTTWLVILRCSW